MARYKTVKKDSEIDIPGVQIEVERQDNSVKAVTVYGVCGSLLRITSQSGYSFLDLAIPEPPKMVERFQVTGTVLGLAFEEYYKTEYEAEKRVTEVVDHNGTATQTKVEVPEEEG